MKTQVISLIQQKGGAGRSTVSTNLAAILSKQHPTALVDADPPQGTATSWYYTRREAGLADGITLAGAQNARELAEKVKTLRREGCVYVVIDPGPRVAEVTRAATVLADLCIVPVGASIAEIWSTADVMTILEEARGVRPDLAARLLWVRFRGYTTEAQEITTAAKRELPLRQMKTRVGYRVAYTEALGRGRSVTEWHDSTARAEMTALAGEVIKTLRGVVN